jgi:hypothetical protein
MTCGALVVGIREHDASFGPAAPEANDELASGADPFWLPLGAPKSNILNPAFFPAAPSPAADEPVAGAAGGRGRRGGRRGGRPEAAVRDVPEAE